MDTFQFGVSAQILFEEFWHQFADIHIEQSKQHLYGPEGSDADPVKKAETQKVLALTLREYLKMFHPFIPFITERIWKEVPKIEGDHESLMYTSW
jgi:valyl-tRNA synthetase